MKIQKLGTMAACLAVCLGLAAAALAQGTAAPPKGEAVISSVTVTATVAKINQKTRWVTVKADDGQKYTFVADPAVQNLAQVKVGDVVTVTYTEALAYEVKKGGKAGADEVAGAVAAPPGARPAGVAADQTTVTVKIRAIDPKVPSVTVATKEGDRQTFKLKDPAKLQGVNVGDTVQITYTEAIALKVDPKAKK
ncbi:MAG TPA: hypothetical protein VMH79_01115 [Thermoanaerobaculia bacterium]|nr:hypothetical protein [Thermoanaerobaculia bacterium]